MNKPNFDEKIKTYLEQIFPIKVISKDNSGMFLCDERFPQFEGTLVKFNSAAYDEVSNHMTFSYDVLDNPKKLPKNSVDLEKLLFSIVSAIYEIESKLLLNRMV